MVKISVEAVSDKAEKALRGVLKGKIENKVCSVSKRSEKPFVIVIEPHFPYSQILKSHNADPSLVVRPFLEEYSLRDVEVKVVVEK